MQLPRAIITSKLEKCLKITHLPTSSKKSDKKGKIAIRIFFPFQQNFPLLPCPLSGNCISLSIVSAESQQSKYKHIRTYSFLQLSQGQVCKQQCRFSYLLEKVMRNTVLRNRQFQFKLNFDPKQCTCAVESSYSLCTTLLSLHSSFQTAREAPFIGS